MPIELRSKMFTAERGSAQWGAEVITDVRNIEANRTMEENRAMTSSTDGKFDRRVAGDDIQGTFTVYLDVSKAGPDDLLPFVPGSGNDGTTILLLKNSDNQTLYNDYAVIIGISFAVPIEGGNLVEATVTWGRIIATP